MGERRARLHLRPSPFIGTTPELKRLSDSKLHHRVAGTPARSGYLVLHDALRRSHAIANLSKPSPPCAYSLAAIPVSPMLSSLSSCTTCAGLSASGSLCPRGGRDILIRKAGAIFSQNIPCCVLLCILLAFRLSTSPPKLLLRPSRSSLPRSSRSSAKNTT